MADTSAYTSIGRSILNRLIGGGIIAVVAILIGGIIVAVALLVRYYRQFNIKVRIKTKRGSGSDGKPIYKTYYDKGGIIFKRKDKRNVFKIFKERVELPVPPYEVMQILANGGNEVNVRKESDTEYYFEQEADFQRGYTYNEYGEQVQITKPKVKIVESDVSYWNVLRKKDNRKLFDVEGLLMKLLPYAVIFLMIIGVIFFTYIWLDKSPSIISATQEVAKALENAANALRDASVAQAAVTGG